MSERKAGVLRLEDRDAEARPTSAKGAAHLGVAAAGLYLFGFALIANPLVDVLSGTWPPRPGNLQWRYGFAGILAGFTHTPILGLALAMVTAFVRRSPYLLRFLSIACLVGAALLTAVLVSIAIDSGTVRNLAPQARQSAVAVGTVVMGLKHILSALILTAFGWSGWRGAGSLRASHRRSHKGR